MKKVVFLFIGLLFIAIVVTMVLGTKRLSPLPPVATITPTPVAIMLNPRENFTITSVDPVENAQDIALNQTITVTFNKSIPTDSILFSMNPAAPYHLDSFANTIHVNLLENLHSDTSYTYTIGYKGTDFSRSFHFTTVTQAIASSTAAVQDNAAQTNQDWLRGNDAGLFLVNYMPQQADTYSVTYDTTTEQPYHYYFTVTLASSDKNAAKQDFLNWLRSIGLTNTQVVSLDIRYQ